MVLRDLEERRAAERALDRLSSDNELLQGELRERQGQLIGNTPPMRKLLEDITQVAPTDAPVLVTGETGTGKRALGLYGAHQFAETLGELHIFAVVNGTGNHRNSLIRQRGA